MIYLTLPTKAYLSQIAEYRAEFLAAGDSMDGTGPLRRVADPAEWLRETENFISYYIIKAARFAACCL